nr:immunoglobulin heavy chain junction region [Macaca mulatta]
CARYGEGSNYFDYW